MARLGSCRRGQRLRAGGREAAQDPVVAEALYERKVALAISTCNPQGFAGDPLLWVRFIAAACMGLGFAWFPEDAIRSELNSGSLKPLPMREGAERFGQLYLIFADADFPTRSAVRMAAILREDVVNLCPLAQPPGSSACQTVGVLCSLKAY